MNWTSYSFRIWLFRILVAIAAFLMIWSFTSPWWIAELSGIIGRTSIDIYAYGIQDREMPVALMNYMSRDITPLYQTVFAWVYLAVSVVLVLGSTWIKGIKGQAILGITGAGFIAYAATAAFIVIANRTAEFGIPFQGSVSITAEGTTTNISTSLTGGYYMAYAAGGLLLSLAILRSIIIGKSMSFRQS